MRKLDLPEAHAAVAPIDVLIEERRTLYRLATELLATNPGAIQDVDVVDSPAARGRIGQALADGGRFDAAGLVRISAVARDDVWPSADGCSLPVAAKYDANELLSDALDWFRAEIAAQSQAAPLRLLTEADGAPFNDAVRMVAQGIGLAMSVSPALVRDLLPHVALLGIVAPESGGRLGSASSRSFPGLVLLSTPHSAIEAAEGLIHEAAHQKLFDLAITRDLLTHQSDRCEPFQPTWPPGGRQWPMEQTLAAGHAYACLARFAADAADHGVLETAGPASLLSKAADRSKIIGDWLLAHGDWLGTDAHTLMTGLFGRRPLSSTDAGLSARPLAGLPPMTQGLRLHRCPTGGRAVVGVPTQPPQLFFVDAEAAVGLE